VFLDSYALPSHEPHDQRDGVSGLTVLVVILRALDSFVHVLCNAGLYVPFYQARPRPDRIHSNGGRVLTTASGVGSLSLRIKRTTAGSQRKQRSSLFHRGYMVFTPSRQDLYKGGLISVTSRILVVDMLQSEIPTELVSSIVVLHAEG